MLAVEPMGEILLLWVKVVEHNISIRGTAGCEDDDFSHGGQFFEEFNAMRSHSNTCLYNQMRTDIVVPPSTGKSSFTV